MEQLSPDLPRLLRPRRTGWTRARMVAFLDELSASRCVAYAASAAGMSRESAYRLRRRTSGARFAAAWDLAIRGLIPIEPPGDGHSLSHTRHAQGHNGHAQGPAQDHTPSGISPQFEAAVRRSIASKVGSHEGQGHSRGHTSNPPSARETSPHRQPCPKLPAE